MRNRLVGAAGMLAVSGLMNAPQGLGQPAAAVPRFEVATIKPCKEANTAGAMARVSPGRISLPCASVANLINQSYIAYADGATFQPLGPHIMPLEKAPAWVNDDRYALEAKAESPVSSATMLGPMMRALLAERFKLKIHTETREMPVYALTAATSGPKLQKSREGSCRPFDADHPPPPPRRGQPLLPMCGFAMITNDSFQMFDATVAQIAAGLSSKLDREVIDNTGIAGKFDVRVQLTSRAKSPTLTAPAPTGPPEAPVDPNAAADAFDLAQTVARQLGLNLKAAKGPVRVFVVDHVERPSAN